MLQLLLGPYLQLMMDFRTKHRNSIGIALIKAFGSLNFVLKYEPENDI